MKKTIFVLLIVLITLSSCIKRDDVRLVSFDGVEMPSMSSLNLKVTVGNSSGRNITLTEGRMILNKDGFELAQVIMKEDVVVPKRFEGQVSLPLRLKITDLFGIMSLAQNIDKAAIESITATGSVVIKVGGIKKKVEFDSVPVSKILTTFGVDPTDIKLPI